MSYDYSTEDLRDFSLVIINGSDEEPGLRLYQLESAQIEAEQRLQNGQYCCARLELEAIRNRLEMKVQMLTRVMEVQ